MNARMTPRGGTVNGARRHPHRIDDWQRHPHAARAARKRSARPLLPLYSRWPLV